LKAVDSNRCSNVAVQELVSLSQSIYKSTVQLALVCLRKQSRLWPSMAVIAAMN